MRKKWMITGVLTAGLVLAAAPAAFAGEWKQDDQGWWWQDDDGTYPADEWRWLDGNQDGTAECYYFNELGYLLTNTVTPDNYIVNDNGEWVLEGQLQTQRAGTGITAAGMDGADNGISGAGVVSVDAEQSTVLPGEGSIDRTVGRNFIKQVLMECIGRERSQVEELLGEGGEVEETEDYAAGRFDFHVTYVLGSNEDVRIDYKNDIAVRIFGTNTELLNFEKDEYTLSEIDAILQVEHVTLEGNAHFWHLQNGPDVTIELVDGYALLYLD